MRSICIQIFTTRNKGIRSVAVFHDIPYSCLVLVISHFKLLPCGRTCMCVCSCCNIYVAALKLCGFGNYHGSSCSAVSAIACVTAVARVTGVGICICTLIVRGGYECLGNVLAKYQPCIFGIIDKYVSVTLNTLDNLVSSHFPCVNRVKLHPIKKNVNTFENLSYIGRAPSGAPPYVNVKANSCNISLYVIQRLEICGIIGSAQNSLCRVSAVL